MKIQSIQSYYQRNNYKQPSFQAFKRTVKRPETGEVLWKNNTGFYRIDMSWTYLAEFLKEKYSGVEKVFVYNYASSNGNVIKSMVAPTWSKTGDATIGNGTISFNVTD